MRNLKSYKTEFPELADNPIKAMYNELPENFA